ncbi:MAG: hypothetical protein M3340_13755 [Actinomycetota bacterium]|nr:hypothetical protein [Actinomycetota bacterium]
MSSAEPTGTDDRRPIVVAIPSPRTETAEPTGTNNLRPLTAPIVGADAR